MIKTVVNIGAWLLGIGRLQLAGEHFYIVGFSNTMLEKDELVGSWSRIYYFDGFKSKEGDAAFKM